MRKEILNCSASIAISAAIFFAPGCADKKGENETKIETKESVEHTDTVKARENPYKNAEISIKVYNNDTIPDSKIKGYGYDIYLYKGLYVHQPHIPAINGMRGFDTEEQAKKTGEFIVYKIKNNIMPPTVDVKELDSLGVLK